MSDLLEFDKEISFIEFASETLLDESQFNVDGQEIEFLDDENSVKDDNDEDVESSTVSIIHNADMRMVFEHEAINTLDRAENELRRQPLILEKDDPLNIAIHTLLGNARTLGFDEVALALDSAEALCLAKVDSGLPINDNEREELMSVTAAFRHGIDSASEGAPYYTWDDQQWEEFAVTVQALVKNAKSEIDHSNVNEIEIDGAEFREIGVNEIDVAEIDLEETDIEELDIEELDIEELDIEELDIEELDIEELDIEELDIEELDIEELGIEEIGIEELDIEELDIEESDLEESDLEESDLEESDLEETNLEESDLEKSDLEESDLEKSDLEKSDHEKSDHEKSDHEDTDHDEAVNVEFESNRDRVSAVFRGLDPIDDLVESDEIDSSDNSSEPTDDQELLEFEESLSAFEQDAEPLVSQDKTQAQSLIPDDLANLLEEDMLDDAALNIEQLEDNEINDVDQISEQDETTKIELEPEALTPVEPDEEVSEELRTIFVEELRGLHHELDDEIAKLSTLGEMAPAMANILRHLHTVKGSSLMADARRLGELTHHTETFLETNFIRNDVELKQVRQTLEQYLDTLDVASKAYRANSGFSIPVELMERLGVAPDESADVSDLALNDPQVLEEVEKIEEDDLSVDFINSLTEAANDIQKVQDEWHSARGWKKIQAEISKHLAALSDVVNQGSDEAGVLMPLIKQTHEFVNQLSPSKANEYRAAKALLQESIDTIVEDGKNLSSGQQVSDSQDLISRLSADQTKVSDADADKAAGSNLSEAKTLNAPLFVPGASEPNVVDQEDKQRQDAAAKERAAALRIHTDTLDSLTNFVGDASMNRSQMREEVVTIKTVVEDLYSNVQRFGKQLRELEIETDTKISSRTNENVTDRSDEFDPLELDRYTKLQQLSRGLTENLDELGTIQNSLSSFVYRAETSLQKQERLNRELQDEIMQVRLVSFGGVGAQLRQVVRRTSRELGKDAQLKIEGADVRLDKAILDGVVPALEHMLRNAVDHGIESPEQRVKARKPKTGQITLECRQVAREIVISVRDDGVGLDLEKIRAKAIEDKLLSADQELNPQDMLMYISQSGFSTAEKLTQISGRGVGMDVVQFTLRRMSGSISYDVDNQSAGSHFIIRLPISLAVTSAMFVECGGEAFAISARTIERVVNVDVDDLIGYLKADKPRMEVDGVSYALIDVADYLGYDSKLPILTGKLSVILVNVGVQNIAVIVEQLFETQEIVVKNLGDHLGRIPIYSGATIRADGAVVLVLDLVGISYYESFVAIPEQGLGVSHVIPTVMVVDDSLTIRKSAERDINGVGINSVLAKDGVDAQIQLRQEVPDMILLDIEMPRMDGFELLEWIKSEDALKYIPVIMISSRATQKYVDKATELGCSAFLGKPYLLESLVQLFNQHLDLEQDIVLD